MENETMKDLVCAIIAGVSTVGMILNYFSGRELPMAVCAGFAVAAITFSQATWE